MVAGESGVEIVHGLFCEFIREEPGGKVSLLGVFGDEVKFMSAPPAVLSNLGLYVFVRNPEKRPLPAKLAILLPGGQTVEELPLEVPGGVAAVNMSFNFVGQMFDRPMTVVATLRIEVTPPVVRQFKLNVMFQPAQPSAAR